MIVGDGGTVLGGVLMSGPQITDVDLLDGTIFPENTYTETTVAETPFAAQTSVGTSLTNNLISVDGIIGSVTFDTTGITTGSYDLNLVSGIFETSIFNGAAPIQPLTLQSGSILVATAVPEPSSVALLFGLGGYITLHRRRRK